MNARRKLDPDILRTMIKSKGYSIRSLGEVCEVNEKTIRRALDNGYITIGVGLDICRTLHCTFNQAFGPDDSEEWAKINDILWGGIEKPQKECMDDGWGTIFICSECEYSFNSADAYPNYCPGCGRKVVAE